MYEVVVIGGSAGSIEQLLIILKDLPRGYSLPVIIVVHLHASDDGALAKLLDSKVRIPVMEACDKQPIKAGMAYIAPANYHLLIEHDKTFALSVDKKVNYARPSIDVLFESAAFVYLNRLVGILLTGASNDGAKGISTIKQFGGLTIVQDPATAKHALMPQSAVDTGCVDRFLSSSILTEILR